MIKFSESSILKRCNKAEYAYVASGYISRVMAVGIETLHVPAELFQQFQDKYAILEDLVSKSRAADETAKIDDVDIKVNNLLKFLFSVINCGTTTPVDTKREAAAALCNVIKSYLKIRRLPRRQKVQTTKGLLLDLGNSNLTAHIETLGLEAEVEMLTLLNAQYAVLLDSRASAQLHNSEEKSYIVRSEMYELYDQMTAAIWVQSFTEPSEAVTEFIKSINKLLADTETAYNQRRAQSNKKEDDDSGENDNEGAGIGDDSVKDETSGGEQEAGQEQEAN